MHSPIKCHLLVYAVLLLCCTATNQVRTVGKGNFGIEADAGRPGTEFIIRDRANYTHYIGKTTKPDEEWIRIAGHKNMNIYPFSAELHIPDYWDDSKNPCHCCVHPDEYTEPQFQGFLQDIGKTDGAAMVEAAQKYESLVSDWVLSVIP